MMKSLFKHALSFTIASFLFLTTIIAQKASIKEEAVLLNTYGFSDPDPVPHNSTMYPYFRFDAYTSDGVEKEWNMVVMENPYIKVYVAPEVGGKVWGAIDKKTGKEFLYFNHTAKFREVGMRGAWTSGGIEFNFGIIGHAPSCSTPVDYFVRENDDGSVSCFVGATDLASDSRWSVEINLPADKAFFTTKSTWQNSSPLIRSYYHWTNSGIKAAGNLELVYPGTHYIGHDGSSSTWPNREDGHPINFYKKNDFGGYKSYHVLGSYTDFFGGYWHDDDFGTVHYAPYDQKPGKKAWIWGLSRQGMIWEGLLTDTDGQYVEIQSGRLFNQAIASSTNTPFKHRGFVPGTTESWTEHWYPVSEIKGFNAASPYAVANFKYDGKVIDMKIYAVQDLKERLKVFDKDKLIFEGPVLLDPTEILQGKVTTNVKKEDISIQIGKDKLRFEFDPEAGQLQRPQIATDDFDWNSTYGLYLQAKEWFYQRQFKLAIEKVEECIEADPAFLPGLTLAAWISYYRMDYQAAFDFARKALSIDTYDPQANFVYGLSSLELGHLADARDGFSIAAADPGWKPAALLERSKLELKEGNYRIGRQYAQDCLTETPENTDALQLFVIANRLTGDKDGANRGIDHLLQKDPLNHLGRFEKYLLSDKASDLKNFNALIRNELPHETYLELAHFYIQSGEYTGARKVLMQCKDHPVKYYWLAWLARYDELDKEQNNNLSKAFSLSPELVFPYRPFTKKVLIWAKTAMPDWKTDYYLACIEWSRQNDEMAKEALDAAKDKADYAPFYLMKAALEDSGDKKGAYLKKAVETEPESWRAGLQLGNYLLEKGDAEAALELAVKYQQSHPGYFAIQMLYVNALNAIGKYTEVLGFLEKTTFLPKEGSEEGRLVYYEACMREGIELMENKKYKKATPYFEKALLWPENLGVGKPYLPDERLEYFIQGLCELKRKKRDLAMEWFQKTVDCQTDTPYESNTLIEAFAQKYLGNKVAADKMMKEWGNTSKDSRTMRLCHAIYEGDDEKVTSILLGKEAEKILLPYETPKLDPPFIHIVELWGEGLLEIR